MKHGKRKCGSVVMDNFSFESESSIVYEGGATFVRRCEKCYCFVKPDKTIIVDGFGALKEKNKNCYCKKCKKRSNMIFEGYY